MFLTINLQVFRFKMKMCIFLCRKCTNNTAHSVHQLRLFSGNKSNHISYFNMLDLQVHVSCMVNHKDQGTVL